MTENTKQWFGSAHIIGLLQAIIIGLLGLVITVALSHYKKTDSRIDTLEKCHTEQAVINSNAAATMAYIMERIKTDNEIDRDRYRELKADLEELWKMQRRSGKIPELTLNTL